MAMNRKKFLKTGLLGVGTILASQTVLSSCKKEDEKEPSVDASACVVSPKETAGPFPIKTPADLVRANIVGDRKGIPLVINYKVEDTNNGCKPLAGVYVDIWHCDSQGNYSEYAGQQDGDFTQQNFLRGRQKTDANGIATFVSIYPGWYPGRAPHIHVEVKTENGKSLLITQTAFPENISNMVYATSGYNGNFDTSNTDDNIFNDGGLNRNIADTVTGNAMDGYTLNETIKVST